MNRVNSQQARRVLDRLVGYVGSPVVRKQIRGAQSVGRVQTVALRLVVERESLIKDFNPEAYWVLGAQIAKQVDPRDAFTVNWRVLTANLSALKIVCCKTAQFVQKNRC